MPIPDLTDFGLLPPGVHNCTIPEAEIFLCSNDHRSMIWAGLQGFLVWAQALPQPDAFLIDGSYVTDKPLPSDADVVVDISTCSQEDQEVWFKAWDAQHAEIKELYRVDFYPFVVGAGSDFSAFFQYVRVDDALRRGASPTTRKGMLRVNQ